MSLHLARPGILRSSHISKQKNQRSFLSFIAPLQAKYYVNHIFIFWRSASQLLLSISCDAPFIFINSIEQALEFHYQSRAKIRGKNNEQVTNNQEFRMLKTFFNSDTNSKFPISLC
jgi:hypothetical protein